MNQPPWIPIPPTTITASCDCDRCGKPLKVDMNHSECGIYGRAVIHSCESDECVERERLGILGWVLGRDEQ